MDLICVFASRVPNAELGLAKRFGLGGQRVLDEARPDFLHRNPFELMRVVAGLTVETWQRATPQLLRALRGYVHEQKTAGDWSGLIRPALWIGGPHIDVLRHMQEE